MYNNGRFNIAHKIKKKRKEIVNKFLIFSRQRKEAASAI